MNTMGGPRNRNASVGDEFIPHSPCGMSIKGDPSMMSRVPPCKISPEQQGRKQAVPPASPTTSSHPLTLRRMLSRGKSSSAATTLARDVSSYAGPQPIGRDGLPLRSCLKHACTPPTSASSDSSVMGGGSGGRCCHKVSFSHVQLREYCRYVRACKPSRFALLLFASHAILKYSPPSPGKWATTPALRAVPHLQ